MQNLLRAPLRQTCRHHGLHITSQSNPKLSLVGSSRLKSTKSAKSAAKTPVPPKTATTPPPRPAPKPTVHAAPTPGFKPTVAALSTPAPAAKAETALSDTLSWPEYFDLRKKRRRWQTYISFPAAAGGFFGGAFYFGSLETDPTVPIMGVDPLMFYGGCTILCSGFGFLIGPTIGSGIWRMIYRNSAAKVDAKDRDFFQHIARNRVDATLQSATSPIPDYYGEKVGSLRQYRQWLRDQSKFRRKAMHVSVD